MLRICRQSLRQCADHVLLPVDRKQTVHVRGVSALVAVQGLDKSSLPRNTRMVALGNRANFEFRAFQVHT